MERYKNIEQALHRELEKIDKKYGTNSGEMDQADLDHVDMIYHALKSAATYHAMKDAEEDYGGEYSGRGRSYYSGMPTMRRGYRGGPYGARDDGYSGHYPMENADPYWDRRY